MKASPSVRTLSLGLGLRPAHYAEILETKPPISWFEAITENHMRGRPLAMLEKVRAEYPIVLHGVSMSIGSTDPLNFEYLKDVKDLAAKIEPEWISDHICWTGVGGENLHDLMPLPYTEETLQHLSERILRVEDFLGRPVAFENVSAYLSFRHSEMSEWEFLIELCRRSGCQLLLDINNIYVSSINQGFEALEFLRSIPKSCVRQFHLAGHSEVNGRLIDTHDHAVAEPVWALFSEALRHFGKVPTLLERDGNIPPLCELRQELARAEKLWNQPGEHAQALTC